MPILKRLIQIYLEAPEICLGFLALGTLYWILREMDGDPIPEHYFLAYQVTDLKSGRREKKRRKASWWKPGVPLWIRLFRKAQTLANESIGPGGPRRFEKRSTQGSHHRARAKADANPRTRPAPPDFGSPDPHRVLGITPEAATREIQLAYRNLLKRYHPDRARLSSLSYSEAQLISVKIIRAKEAMLKRRRHSVRRAA